MNTLFFSFLGHPLFTSHSLFPISFLSPFLFPSHPISPSSLYLLLSSFYCLSLWNTPKRLNQLPIQNLPVYSTAYQNVTLDYVQFYGLVKSVVTNSTWFFLLVDAWQMHPFVAIWLAPSSYDHWDFITPTISKQFLTIIKGITITVTVCLFPTGRMETFSDVTQTNDILLTRKCTLEWVCLIEVIFESEGHGKYKVLALII